MDKDNKKQKETQKKSQEVLFKKIKEVLEKYPEILLCILFGSSVNNQAGVKKDIDVAVAASSSIALKPDYLAELQLDLEKKLKFVVDILDLNKINGVILQQVLCKGEIIKRTSDILHVSLIKKMWYNQADMMPNYYMIVKKRASIFAYG